MPSNRQEYDKSQTIKDKTQYREETAKESKGNATNKKPEQKNPEKDNKKNSPEFFHARQEKVKMLLMKMEDIWKEIERTQEE